MKTFLTLIIMFFAVNICAQDYYLTKEKNKEPLRVKSSEDIGQVLKQQNKENKYQPVILSSDATQAVYILVPKSLHVTKDEGAISVSNLNMEDDGSEENSDGFELGISLKDNPEDIDALIKEYTEDNLQEIKPQTIEKLYGRNKFTQYSFNVEDIKLTILTAPYDGKYINFNFITKVTPAGKKDKYSAVLGIAASSLNKAVFNSSAPKAVPEVSKEVKSAPESSEHPAVPLIEDITSRQISAREVKTDFNLVEGDKVYSYSITLPSDLTFKQEGNTDARIILKQNPDAVMWLEPVFKTSKAYNDEMLLKYAAGKKFNHTVKEKIKLGGKDINFVKKTALNENSYTYFFHEGGRRFALSFVAPSARLGEYERAAAKVLSKFVAR